MTEGEYLISCGVASFAALIVVIIGTVHRKKWVTIIGEVIAVISLILLGLRWNLFS